MTANEMKFNFQLKYDSLFEFSAPAYDDRQISYLLTEAQFRVFIRRYNPLANKYQKGFEADEQRRRDLEQLIESASILGTGTTGAITYVASWSSGDPTITLDSGNTNGLNEGQTITGTGIGPSGATTENTIKSIISDTIFTVENNPSSSGSGITLTGGLGKASAQGMVHPNGVFFDLPDGFLYAIEEAVTLNDGDSDNSKESWVKPVRHDEYLANINNPYKQPYKDLVWRMDISRQTHAEGTSIEATPKRTEIITPSGYTVAHYRMRYLSLPPSIVVDEFDETNQRHCTLDETLHREIVDEAVVIAQAAVKPDKYQVGLSEAQRDD